MGVRFKRGSASRVGGRLLSVRISTGTCSRPLTDSPTPPRCPWACRTQRGHPRRSFRGLCSRNPRFASRTPELPARGEEPRGFSSLFRTSTQTGAPAAVTVPGTRVNALRDFLTVLEVDSRQEPTASLPPLRFNRLIKAGIWRARPFQNRTDGGQTAGTRRTVRHRRETLSCCRQRTCTPGAVARPEPGKAVAGLWSRGAARPHSDGAGIETHRQRDNPLQTIALAGQGGPRPVALRSVEPVG